jgi:hypothetical protein
VCLVGLAERRLSGTGRRATGWAHGAYVAFVIQGPVLMGLACAARPLDAPAELKAPLVGAAGIAVCFWLGRHLGFLTGPRHRRARPPQWTGLRPDLPGPGSVARAAVEPPCESPEAP